MVHAVQQYEAWLIQVETTNQGPDVQSIVSLTSSLRGQLVKFFTNL